MNKSCGQIIAFRVLRGPKFIHSLIRIKSRQFSGKEWIRKLIATALFMTMDIKNPQDLQATCENVKSKKFFVCGLAADFCVYFTAKDALNENFKTYIIEDATRAIDPAGFDKVKKEIFSSGGQIIKREVLCRH